MHPLFSLPSFNAENFVKMLSFSPCPFLCLVLKANYSNATTTWPTWEFIAQVRVRSFHLNLRCYVRWKMMRKFVWKSNLLSRFGYLHRSLCFVCCLVCRIFQFKSSLVSSVQSVTMAAFSALYVFSIGTRGRERASELVMLLFYLRMRLNN